MRRHKMSRGHSKRLFRKTADLTHRRNMTANRPVLRGGIRL